MESFRKKWIDFEPEILPEQERGRMLEAHRRHVFADADSARMAYLNIRERLLNINEWNRYSDGLLADFALVNDDGEIAEGQAASGLYIRIDMPGPGPSEGDGFDWALIDEYEEDGNDDFEYVAFRVKPASNPESQEEGTAHFFAPESSGTMVLYRDNVVVCCTIYDRNLRANTEESVSFTDKIRNAVVGNVAAMGFSGIQWQQLVDSLWGGENYPPE